MNGPTKVCTGPAHHGPTRIPLDAAHWYFHRSGRYAGQPTSRCKLCTNWRKLVGKEGPHGLASARTLRPLAKELVDRCGSLDKVGIMHGIGRSTLAPIVRGEQEQVQKKTAARILLALSEQRKYDRRNGATPRFLAARKAQAAIEERMERTGQY